MPRPLRIEYENAYYHVMNRGRGRNAIFHGNVYYYAFLETLEEAHQRFNLQVLCYCLMGNHYHLLVKVVKGVKYNINYLSAKTALEIEVS